MSPPPRPSASTPPRRGASLTTLLVSLALAVYLAAVVWRYRGLLMDDAYIVLCYVRNLLAGRGLNFQPPRRVEGITDLGWALLLAPLALAMPPPLAARLAAAAGIALTAVLLALAARRLEVSPRSEGSEAGSGAPPAALWPLAVAALTLTAADFASFSLLGMETGALGAVLAAMLLAAASGRRALASLLGTLAFLLHPEAALVAPLALALAWRLGALSARQLGKSLAVAAGGLAAATLARYAYYGALLPNTWSAKPPSLRSALANLADLAAGTAVNVGFPCAGLWALGLVAAGLWALARRHREAAAWAAATVATGLVFAVYARPDWTELGRYFAPYAPVALLAGGAGALAVEREIAAGSIAGRRLRLAGLAFAALALLAAAASAAVSGSAGRYGWAALAPAVWAAAIEAELALGRRRDRGDRLAGRLRLAPLALAAAVAAAGAWDTFARASPAARGAYPGYIATSRTLVAPARALGARLPAGASIASRRIGALAYYSGHPVFDYAFGLTEPEVARLIRRRGREIDDPNDPALAALWRARRPDFLLEDGELIARIAAAAGGTPRRFTVQGSVYRTVGRFPIARGVDWVLAERSADAAVAGK